MFDNEAKQTEIKFKSRIKLKHNIYVHKIIWPVTFLHLISPANVI